MNAEIAALVVVLGVVALIFVYTLLLGSPPTPTSPKVKSRILAVLPEMSAGTIYELGSGWGGLALSLARRYPDNTVIALEASPLPCMVSSLRRWLSGSENLTIQFANFLDRPLGDAAMVVCYLQGDTMARLRTKFETELPPGTNVLTHTFQIAGWQPYLIYEADDIYRTPIYLYEMEENAGTAS